MSKNTTSLPDWQAPVIPTPKDFTYGILPGSSCQYCQNRRDLHSTVPDDCLVCGWYGQRNRPYSALVPIWHDDIPTPTGKQRLSACERCEKLAVLHPDLNPEQFKELLGKKGELL